MSALELRVAVPQDADLVASLLWQFNAEFQTWSPSVDELATRLTVLLALDEVVVVLAVEQEAVGLVFVTLRPTPYWDGPLAQLEELYVRPQLRDRGIGTALLQCTLQLCRQRRAAEMNVNVDEGDAGARRFYERHGFRNILPDGDSRMLYYEQQL